jgi:16S rRNA (adenine1518-N6/adenine1519-N6)-dimethyltransferase
MQPQRRPPPVDVPHLLRSLNLSPRKALGQHFLVSRGVLKRILDAAELEPGDIVIEVGPGLGTLTRELVRCAGRVIAVELDRELAEVLPAALGHPSNLTLVNADAREVEPLELLPGRVPYKLVANLPYFAASPILRCFLEASWKPTLIVVMLQREVAQSIAARPGGMSLIGVSVQFYGRPRIVGYVPPGAFYPPPKVTSAILRIDVFPEPPIKVEDVEAFFGLVRAGFSAPRKQLRNALSLGLGIPTGAAQRLLERAGLDPRRRAESLTLEEWEGLYRAYREAG